MDPRLKELLQRKAGLKTVLGLLLCSAILAFLSASLPGQRKSGKAIVRTDVKPAFPHPIRGEAVRSKVVELMGMDGIPPKEIPFSLGETKKTEDGLLMTPVEFTNSLGETVPGILTLPASAGAGTLAGVVCMPGTHGDAERLTQERFHREDPDKGPLLGWARELSRRGFATLSITLKGTLARRSTLGEWETEATCPLWAPPDGNSGGGGVEGSSGPGGSAAG